MHRVLEGAALVFAGVDLRRHGSQVIPARMHSRTAGSICSDADIPRVLVAKPAKTMSSGRLGERGWAWLCAQMARTPMDTDAWLTARQGEPLHATLLLWQRGERFYLDPLPGNGEAGLLRQVGGTPFDGWWWVGAVPEGEPHWIFLWEQRSCVSSSQ